MEISSEFLLFIISLFFAALFAFLETAFTALRLFKIKELQVSVQKYNSLFACWEKNPQRILITILIANNFAHVVTSVLISHMMQRVLGPLGVAIGIFMATGIILIFGEIIPKTLAKAHHEKVFRSFLWLINIIYRVSYPLVTLVLKISDFLFSKIGRKHMLEKQADDVSEKEIEFLIDYSDQKGLMESKKTEMLQNIFSLGQTLVREIMVPKNEISSIKMGSSLHQAVEIFNKTRFSRLPVYEGKEDNIMGIIHQKDVFELLYKADKKQLKSIVRPILFVPETQKINQLLSELLKKRLHMAIVINEYGNMVGLITLENILEEIVGDISDEHEKISSSIVSLEDGGWLVDGGADLEDLEDLLKIAIETETSVTLSGFLAERLQHLPKKGERLIYKGFCFQVQQASLRRVFQVLVFKNNEELSSQT